MVTVKDKNDFCVMYIMDYDDFTYHNSPANSLVHCVFNHVLTSSFFSDKTGLFLKEPCLRPCVYPR